MATLWFYKQLDEEIGPLTEVELKTHARDGRIQADTHVRSSSMAQWVLAEKVKGLIPQPNDFATNPDTSAAMHAPQVQPRKLPPPVPNIATTPTSDMEIFDAILATPPTTDSTASRYSLQDFVNKTSDKDRQQGVFEYESDRLLEVNLNGMIWTKMGSMVAYLGEVKYEREGVLEHGIGTLFKKALTGEGMSLTKAIGRGKVYLADSGKKITILQLNNEAIFVNGNDVLAFEPSLRHTITMMRKVASVMSGGLFNVRFEGSGLLAITTHYDPLTLRVTSQWPVYTDPNATIAWIANLMPQFKTDVSLKTFFGRGSGESLQMKFQGDGFVVVQPYEEVYMQHKNAGS